MKQINIKNLRNDLSNSLLNLPFEITKRGKVIAIVQDPKCTLQENKSYNKLSKCTPQEEDKDKYLSNDKSKLDSQGKYITFFK